MHKKPFLSILTLLAIILMVSLACGPSTGAVTKATSTEKVEKETATEKVVKPTNTEKPVTPSDTPTPEDTLLVTNIDDAEKATIHIIAEGTVYDPQNGPVAEGVTGSGFIIDPSGIAITNNHVVTGAARIKVYFSDHEKAYNATILGVSECSDMAVIDIEGDGFNYLKWFDGDIKLGLEVYALGYPRGTTSFTRNRGEVSKRPFAMDSSWASVGSVVEHDALINPGSSGGPLVTKDGTVVGINYASNQQDQRYYAITYTEAEPLIERLRNDENVTYMGVNGQAFVLDTNTSGIWVYSVASGSPADNAGLKGGDIITDVEGIRMGQQATMTEYCDILRSHAESDTLAVTVFRTTTGELLEGQFNGRELVVTQGGGGDISKSTPTSEALAWFTEEFDIAAAPGWTYKVFLNNGKAEDVNVYTNGGKIAFEGKNTKPYRMAILFYDAFYYKDVVLDTTARNKGTNNYYYGLVTRYKDGVGFYLFLVNPGGYYGIWRYDWASDTFAMLRTGASTSVKPGKQDNQLTAVTKGTTLSLYVNGDFVYAVDDNTLDEGKIGIGIYVLEWFPVTAEFDYVTIAQP
jgi:S1-C subfamily serine protease